MTRVAVAAEPGWTLSHLQQARSLREKGKAVEARGAYERAISNLINDDLELAPLDWSFTACFTGQLMSREDLEEERDEVA